MSIHRRMVIGVSVLAAAAAVGCGPSKQERAQAARAMELRWAELEALQDRLEPPEGVVFDGTARLGGELCSWGPGCEPHPRLERYYFGSPDTAPTCDQMEARYAPFDLERTEDGPDSCSFRARIEGLDIYVDRRYPPYGFLGTEHGDDVAVMVKVSEPYPGT